MEFLRYRHQAQEEIEIETLTKALIPRLPVHIHLLDNLKLIQKESRLLFLAELSADLDTAEHPSCSISYVDTESDVYSNHVAFHPSRFRHIRPEICCERCWQRGAMVKREI